ncbi:MAG TPA: SPFH domain-containing protein [Streptosporangiaceae bacterium]|nr:SPFH domain-containing protein [Streptosporangiaceae bacterium]
MSSLIATILLVVLAIGVIAAVVKSVRIVPQASAGIVERFGRYHRTLNAGLNIVMPFIDHLRPLIDLREQVVSFPPQPVITMDNLVVGIDTVIYFQVTDPRAATYEVANYITAVEQLTVTTLRNVVGGMELEHALTSRDRINSELRSELDEATGKWGIRVSRVELKAIEPPGSIQESMQKQMRADRDKRAAILSAEGSKQSAILTAEGERQAAVLKARGESEALVLRAEADATAQAVRARGQAEAISTVFRAIHDGNPDQRLLAYQYMQMLPQLAQGDANKVWIVPSEIGKALEGIGGFFSGAASQFAAPPAQAQGPARAPNGAAPVPPAAAVPGLSGPGAQLNTSVAGDSSLEGWLTGGSGTVDDAAVGDHEGGSVPGAGDAGGAPLHHDPALMQGPTEMGAPI